MQRPPEILESARLWLGRRRLSDADEIHRVVIESRDHLSQWQAWAANYGLVEVKRDLIRNGFSWETGESFCYKIVYEGKIVGSCVLAKNKEARGEMEIGYWLHPSYVNLGLATCAAQILVDQAFSLVAVECVRIVHDIANIASGGIPRRLKFAEGERRAVSGPLASAQSGVEVVWRLSRLEWTSRRACALQAG